MEFVRDWIEKSPYSAALGVVLEEVSEGSARLRLPFSDDNTNPGQVLHGGVAASLSSIGGQTVARATLGEESGPWHTASLQVNYLAAARAEDVIANATLLRRGKSLCFVETDIVTDDGKPIAHATAAVRARFGAEPSDLAKSAGDHGESDPGPMGPHIGRIPFMGHRGITVDHMMGGTSRLRMPGGGKNTDADGGIHEGAVLALLDTTGAMASWAEVGPGPYKASTPSMQARILAPAPRGELIAYSRCVQRDGEMSWSDVEVAGASDGRICARGTVIYRIVT
ncbi:MAG: PaaI family thioesterase [Myxococcota bacterium]